MKTIALILNILWLIALIPSAMGALMSPMMFDAPGSEKNTILWVIAGAIVAMPVLIIITQIFAWIKYTGGDYSLALKIGLIPILDLILIIILFMINGSNFSK